MSYSPYQSRGGSGGQQNFYFNDGNTQMYYSSQQINWSTSHSNSPLQSPPMRPSPLPDVSQSQQSHMALHQASMQSAMDMHRNMIGMMQQSTIPPAPRPPQIQYVQSPPQVQYMESPPQIEYVQSPSQIEYAQVAPMVQEISTAQANTYARPPYPTQQPSACLPTQQLDQSKARDEERRRELIRETNKVNTRLQRLEEFQVMNAKQQDVKDKELAAARLREQQLQQQLLEAEQKHSRAVSEMAAAQAAASQQTNTVLDMIALRKVIEEVQTDRISREDIKKLVSDAVQAQLAGVARSVDIDSAASRMEKGLSKLPASAPIQQIQNAVQIELEKAVRKLLKKMPAQQMIEGLESTQGSTAWQQGLRSHIEDSPNDPIVAYPPMVTEALHTCEPLAHRLLQGTDRTVTDTGALLLKQQDRPESAPSPVRNSHRSHHKAAKRLTVVGIEPQDMALISTATHTNPDQPDFVQDTSSALSRRPQQPGPSGTVQTLSAKKMNIPDNPESDVMRQTQSTRTRQLAFHPRSSKPGAVSSTITAPDQRHMLQIEGVPQQVEANMALVKQSKAVARRS